jgi:hypothetical protein
VALAPACSPVEDPSEAGTDSTDGVETSSSTTDPEMVPVPIPGDDAESGGSSSGTADSTGSGDDDDAVCGCVAEVEVFLEVTCEVDEICEPVQVACDVQPLADCELGDLTVVNPGVLECHAAALAAGDVSMLRWELPYLPDPGAAGQRAWIVVLEGRRAITWHEAWGVPAYRFSDTAASTLRGAAYFEACMAEASPEAVFRCLFDATEAPDAVCIPAHEFPIG